MMKYAWVCLYAPVNARRGKGKEDMKKFWNYENECLMEAGRGGRSDNWRHE